MNTQYIKTRLTQAQYDHVYILGKGNVSAGVRRLIEDSIIKSGVHPTPATPATALLPANSVVAMMPDLVDWWYMVRGWVRQGVFHPLDLCRDDGFKYVGETDIAIETREQFDLYTSVFGDPLLSLLNRDASVAPPHMGLFDETKCPVYTAERIFRRNMRQRNVKILPMSKIFATREELIYFKMLWKGWDEAQPYLREAEARINEFEMYRVVNMRIIQDPKWSYERKHNDLVNAVTSGALEASPYIDAKNKSMYKWYDRRVLAAGKDTFNDPSNPTQAEYNAAITQYDKDNIRIANYNERVASGETGYDIEYEGEAIMSILQARGEDVA